MARGDLTDEQWKTLEPHLPPEKPKRGRPNADHQCIINGMLWIETAQERPGEIFPKGTGRGGRSQADSTAGKRRE